MFIAEMGDKTQLLMIAMTSIYTLRDIIIGSGLSIFVLNLMAVTLGSFISSLIPQYIVKTIASLAFLCFAISFLFKKNTEENDAHTATAFGKNIKSPILIIFWTFFIAELGDKTQLTAITFAADAGAVYAITVCIACSIGLFMADLIGMLVGDLIKKYTGPSFLDRLAFVLFLIFGIFTGKDAISALLSYLQS